MRHPLSARLTATVLAAFAFGACSAGRVDHDADARDDEDGRERVYEDNFVHPHAVGTEGSYDSDIDQILAEQYRKNPMFEDDTFDFHVSDGVVSITGEVDSAAERDALVDWVNAAPGVRSVNAEGLRIP